MAEVLILVFLIAGLSIICGSLKNIHQTVKEKLTGISHDSEKIKEDLTAIEYSVRKLRERLEESKENE